MLTAKLTIERLDQNHCLLEKREQLSRSFLRQFMQTLYLQFAQIPDGGYSIIDHTNTSRAVDADGHTLQAFGKGNLMMGAPPGIATLLVCTGHLWEVSAQHLACQIESQYVGIQVGTGTSAVAPTNVALAARISHGRGAEQLEFGGCELVNLRFAHPDGAFDIRRYFTNMSGGNITVNEVGIYGVMCRGDSNAYAGAWAACFARDLVSPGVTVANTELLRVTYTIQITV